MEKHKKQKKLKEIMQEDKTLADLYHDPDMIFKPPKARPIPDFKQKHERFQKELDSKKQTKHPTKIYPFKFNESKKGQPRPYLDLQN